METFETVTNVFKEITIDGTNAYIIEAICGGVLTIVVAVVFYMLYKQVARVLEAWADEASADFRYRDEKNKNALYLDGKYTAYKAGIIDQTAVAESVILTPRPADAVPTVAETLKKQVREEISN